MGSIPRRCKNPKCNMIIVYSESMHGYIEVRGDNKGQLHKFNCDYKPYEVPLNDNTKVSDSISVSSKEFNEAIESLSQQIKSTQQALSRNNSLITESIAKIDAVLRSGF